MDRQLPEFYTGSPVEDTDLRFREAFIEEIRESLQSRHVLLTAPRRTGKTSVMNCICSHPESGTLAIAVNVQDLEHPADFFQSLVDALHDAHPDFVRDTLAKGWDLLKKPLAHVKDFGVGEFKLSLRDSDPNWEKNWRQHGTRFLQQVREVGVPILLVIDELPDMCINIQRKDEELLRAFLAWWRSQRQSPIPSKDNIRWLVGGSVNLKGTLDRMGFVDLINDFEDMTLPILTRDEVEQFVQEMLAGREVEFEAEVPAHLAEQLGRPIPLFMQMATQSLYRRWKRRTAQKAEVDPLRTADVDEVIHELVRESGARDKFQHFYTRIRNYYPEPQRSAAYALLSMISRGSGPAGRAALYSEFARVTEQQQPNEKEYELKRVFNELLLHLENDFYVVEIDEGGYDFSSGILKAWWAKFYAY